MITEKIRVCKTCGKEYLSKGNYQKYCSAECKTKPVYLEKICECCGKPFAVSKSNKDKRFCSRECANNIQYKCVCVICGNEFYSNKSFSKYCSQSCNSRNPDDIRECKMCGKKFFATKSNDKKDKNEFCSHECRNRFPRAITEVGHCKHCGKEMIIYPYHKNWGRGIFCSVNCQMYGGHCDTDIERIVKKYLDDKNIKYEYQYHLDSKYYPDFYFPDKNMIIEVQGDYWHGNPEIYKTEDLNEHQIDHMARDRRKFGYYKHKHIKYYEIWGKDIKENIDNAMSVIQEFAQ